MIFHIIRLKNVSIFDQLLLEEKLLRSEDRNFCILNEGSSPAAVMGISGKHEELLDSEKIKALGYPVIKRYSGGGTVVIDENTLFVSFVCNKKEFDFPSYPEQIMRWSEGVYKKSFHLSDFRLRENDFVLGDLKCGGNAQYITKDRFVQHTSFLWDFCPSRMECLLHPPKMPAYRNNRPHTEFICTLKERFASKEDFFDKISSGLGKDFTISLVENFDFVSSLEESRISTRYINLP